MKFCMVGYGTIAEKHMEALMAIDGVLPQMLVGRREEQTAAFAAKWHFNRYTLALDDALNDSEVEAVIITSPSAMHADQAKKSLKAGKHVLVEIPMALNLEDAQHITQVARQENRRLMVAHTMRYLPGIREVQKRVARGELDIYQVVGFLGQFRRTNITFTGSVRSWTDNILWHHAAHLVDASLWTTGSPRGENIFCLLGPKHPQQGVMDMSLIMTMPEGKLVNIAQSYNMNNFRWRLTFIGEQDTVEFDSGTLYDSKGEVLVPHYPVNGLEFQDKEFIDAIREDRDPSTTGEDILPTMEILHKAQMGAEKLNVAGIYEQ